MSERPLLVFPRPTVAEKSRRFGRGSKAQVPDVQSQSDRLTPKFQRLQQTFDQGRARLQRDTFGLQPEQVLVLETVGPIERFLSAVRRIQGLEWLGELELEEIEPGDGFQDPKRPDKMLSGRVFLIMTDQQALHELQRLFDRWRENPEMKFPLGLNSLRRAFAHLKDIRPWDARDRLQDTGVLEDWQIRMELGQEVVPFEVELWFRNDPARRDAIDRYMRRVISGLDGEIVAQCVLPDIAYHTLLGKLPIGQIGAISRFDDVELIQAEDVMHFRPVGQCAMRFPGDPGAAIESTDVGDMPPSQDEPIIALFDGLPLEKHALLDGRLRIDDPDNFEAGYQARERVHGTAMASLICHGELDALGPALEIPLYVRPILQPNRWYEDEFVEQIPDDILPVDLIHRAVLRLFLGKGGEPPVAPGTKVINLSIGDVSRPFDRAVSPWARLLDWLSWEYNVLFVVSAGNRLHDIELEVPRSDLANVSGEAMERSVITALANDTRHRRLLSPGESMNALTIGASHIDRSEPLYHPHAVDPYTTTELPSPVGAQGPGYLRSIKPELLAPGGRQWYREHIGSNHPNAVLTPLRSSRPPGQCVASPGAFGELSSRWYLRGTSNAAALTTRAAAGVFQVLEELRAGGAEIEPEFDPVILKTLLVHGTECDDLPQRYAEILRTKDNRRGFKEYMSRFFGFGIINQERSTICTDQRITVLGYGQLSHDEAHEYRFPMPPSLSAVSEKRRLTVTLAWFTPINSTRQRYRAAHLWFDPKNALASERIVADGRAVTRGTVQHEVLEGTQAVDFQDGDQMGLKVNCRSDAEDLKDAVKYGLAVSLEVGEGVEIPVYEEVRNRLQIRVPVT